MPTPRIRSPLGRRAALLCAAASVAAPPRANARGIASPRDLYDEAGTAPSAAARALAGRRVALAGYPAPVPSGAAGWFALAEVSLAPCGLCGLTHDWPTGVVAVHAPGAPHLASPYVPVTVEGKLALDPAARDEPGMPAFLVLRDATVAVG